MPDEVPEADMIEQRQSLVADDTLDADELDERDATAGIPDSSDMPFEASEADALDQHRDVVLDDELRADDGDDR